MSKGQSWWVGQCSSQDGQAEGCHSVKALERVATVSQDWTSTHVGTTTAATARTPATPEMLRVNGFLNTLCFATIGRESSPGGRNIAPVATVSYALVQLTVDEPAVIPQECAREGTCSSSEKQEEDREWPLISSRMLSMPVSMSAVIMSSIPKNDLFQCLLGNVDCGKAEEH